MEGIPLQMDSTSLDRSGNVVLDIESLTQSSERTTGSPKMMRALSRKWSARPERWAGTEEEDVDEPSKKLLIKVNSQLEALKQPLITNKTLTPSTTTPGGPNLTDTTDGRTKKFNRFTTINPRKILFLFATISSMGTLILIYFTLEINRTI